MRFSGAVVKHRIVILIVALLLLIPSTLGMIGTRINYDMLNYLPDDMDTVIGQEELLQDFGKGAFSLIVVEDMPARMLPPSEKRSKRSIMWKRRCGIPRWRMSPSRWSFCPTRSTRSSTPTTPP